MNLVGLVVAGQRVHHQINTEPEGDFTLPIGARDDREKGASALVDSPCRGIVVAADDDG